MLIVESWKFFSFSIEKVFFLFRESYMKRRERDEQKRREPVLPQHYVSISKTEKEDTIKDTLCDDNGETDRLLTTESASCQEINIGATSIEEAIDNSSGLASRKGSKKEGVYYSK